MKVVNVQDPEMAWKLYRFRYEMYVLHLKWFNSKDYPAGLVRDNFDDFSQNYIALDDQGMVIGSIRITFDSADRLPLEKCISLNGFRKGKFIAELSRLAIHPRYRGNILGALLMKAGYQCAIQQGAIHIVIETDLEYTPWDRDAYQEIGFEQLGDKYYNSTYPFLFSVVMVLDCIAAKKAWPYTRPRLYRFFTSPDSRIVHPK